TINLVVICAMAGIILSATWAMTDPVRLAKEAQEREAALKALIPDADSIKPVKDVVIADKEGIIYRAERAGATTGYVVLSYGRGYSSFIRMLVAVDMEYRILGIDILGHGETPGLGDQIQTDEFKARFKGKAPENLKVVKGETETDIQAISGATVSSRAVTKGAKDAVETLKRELEAGAL
ncbi:MAG TPA: RnfABCDGE type electron transport complex subunit G, partial [Nitrospirota bacterium]|nr:RnfABCDGE type electron transport complex subunit G [Nitrospirota bacterium]